MPSVKSKNTAGTGTTSTKNLNSKAQEINKLLSEPHVDLWRLRELALTEGGLVNDTLRRRAWPKLVGLHSNPTVMTSHDRATRSRTRGRLPPKSSATTSTMSAVTSASSITSASTTALSLSASLPPSSPSSSPSAVASLSPSPKKKKTQGPSQGSLRARQQMFDCIDHDQIDRDTARCTWHLLTGSQRSRRRQMKQKHKKKVHALLTRKQIRLGNMINCTIKKSYEVTGKEENERLNYYQGYHDVACIFLSALGGNSSGPTAGSNTTMDSLAMSMGLDLPCRVLLQVSRSHLRDAMKRNFLHLQSCLRLTVFPLLAVFDSELHSHLFHADMEPYFCLSWVITWFSHDIRDTPLVKRLFDAFLVSHPLLPVYMSVAMVLHSRNREQVLAAEWGDFASVHRALSDLPKNSSTVGWKSVGDGYMSGEDEQEDGTLSTDDMNTTSDVLSLGTDVGDDIKDYMLVDVGQGGDVMNASVNTSFDGSTSMLSGTNLLDGGKVSFQELLDLAISYMRRIPPRNLLKLARKYHTMDESLLATSSSIAMLLPPPSWGLASTTPSDWLLKQRMRDKFGKAGLSRKDRRKRSLSRDRSASRERSIGGEKDVQQNATSVAQQQKDRQFQRRQDALKRKEDVERYLQEQRQTLAVVAVGFGPAEDEERILKRKRRKMLIRGSVVAVALLAIAIGVAQTYNSGNTTSSPESDSTAAASASSRRVMEDHHQAVPVPPVIEKSVNHMDIATTTTTDVRTETKVVDSSSSSPLVNLTPPVPENNHASSVILRGQQRQGAVAKSETSSATSTTGGVKENRSTISRGQQEAASSGRKIPGSMLSSLSETTTTTTRGSMIQTNTKNTLSHPMGRLHSDDKELKWQMVTAKSIQKVSTNFATQVGKDVVSEVKTVYAKTLAFFQNDGIQRLKHTISQASKTGFSQAQGLLSRSWDWVKGDGATVAKKVIQHQVKWIGELVKDVRFGFNDNGFEL